MHVQVRWMILPLLVMGLVASFASASSTSGDVPARVAGHVRGRLLEIKADRPRLQSALPDSSGELANEFWNRAAGTIMMDETLKRQIIVDESRLKQLADELATSHFKSLDASGMPREVLYAKARQLNQNLHRALEQWKQDPQAGDALARELKLDETSWQWLKYHHTQPQVIKGIEQGMNYGDEQIHQDALTNARRLLLQEGLIQSVAREHPMPADYPKQYAKWRAEVLARGGILSRLELDAYCSGQLRDKDNRPDSVPYARRRGIPQIVSPGPSALHPESERYLMEALAASGMQLSDETWSAFHLDSQSPNFLPLTFVQYRFTFEAPATDDAKVSDLPADVQAQLTQVWQVHMFARWLVDRLREDVTLEPDSQWARGQQ